MSLNNCPSSEISPAELLEYAEKAMRYAYAPYSNFKVGAALAAEDGKIYTGCNIENAAFGPSICAERVAISNAVSSGCRQFRAIAVVGGNGGVPDQLTTPCGVCRQVLLEFCTPDFPVIMRNSDGTVLIRTLGELIPDSFSPAMLNRNDVL